MVNIKIVKLNKTECSWVGLVVSVMTDYAVVSSVLGF
jgi:hypothetical protein